MDEYDFEGGDRPPKHVPRELTAIERLEAQLAEARSDKWGIFTFGIITACAVGAVLFVANENYKYWKAHRDDDKDKSR